jgi:putative DNA primase/helicase
MTTSDLSNSALNLLNSESSLPNPDQSCQALSKTTQSCQELSKLAQTYSFICDKHLAEWVQGSGVNPAVVDLKRCLRSLTDRTVIATKLGWKKYSDNLPLGWFLSGLDLTTMKRQSFGQYKPDEEIRLNAEDEDTQKYLTPKKHLGPYDAIALPHATDKNYWQRILDDPSILVDIDEGGKKSGAGMTCGFPSLALCGVAMWQFKGELVSNLAALAVPGRTFRIRFDMDVLTKKEVRFEIKKLVKVLEERGCTVLVAMWNPELGLKIDDVLVKHGPEMVKKIMADAVPYPQWLKSLEAQMNSAESESRDTPAKAKKPPTPRRIAAEIAEQYGNQWKFDNEQKTWRIWTSRAWEKIEIGNFETLLQTVIDAKNIDYTGDAYLTDVLKLLTKRLRVARWQVWDRKRYTNFNNCVLDADNFKTLEHSPGMGFTSHLPYEYKPLAGKIEDALEALKLNCPNIYNWMKTAMQGSAKKMLKLLAIVNGLLKFRFFDLQMFVHLVGKPGSGKGTFARLLEKVVGYANFAACQLDKLKDGSTVASIIDKQLVVFGDERKPVGVDSILSLTGGDAVSYREVYQRASNAFFYGLILICSNKPIFVGDTTGLDRRLCLLHFDNPIPTERRNYSIEQSFDVEIPSLIAIALTLSNSLVTQLIQGKGESQIDEFKAKEWEMKYQTDSIAAYFNDKLIIAEDSTLKTSTFYSDYKLFCEEAGLRPLSLVKFPTMFYDLCTELGFAVTWERTRGRSYFHGVRLRTEADNQPTYSETLSPMTGVETENDGGLTGVVRGLKPASVGSCGGFNENIAKLSESSEPPPNILEKIEDLSKIKCFDPLQPPSNAEVPNQQGIQPPSNPRQTPVKNLSTPVKPPSETSPPAAAKYKVGDQVQVRSDYVTPALRDQQAVIVKDFGDDQYYQIDFGRFVENYPSVEPRRFFSMDKEYFRPVGAEQLNIPF